MLKKHIRRLARLDGEILLDFAALRVRAERRIGKYKINLLRRLNIGEVFCERIRKQNIRSLHAVKNHIHRTNDERQSLLFFTEKHLLLQRLTLSRRFA